MDPQYCTNVLLMLRGQHVIVVYNLPFFVLFVFAQYTDLCFDTVTLKKLYKVSDMKRKKMAVLFHFAFLYMYFVPKVLFTSVNNSEQCHMLRDPHHV